MPKLTIPASDYAQAARVHHMNFHKFIMTTLIKAGFEDPALSPIRRIVNLDRNSKDFGSITFEQKTQDEVLGYSAEDVVEDMKSKIILPYNR